MTEMSRERKNSEILTDIIDDQVLFLEQIADKATDEEKEMVRQNITWLMSRKAIEESYE